MPRSRFFSEACRHPRVAPPGMRGGIPHEREQLNQRSCRTSSAGLNKARTEDISKRAGAPLLRPRLVRFISEDTGGCAQTAATPDHG
jgi:hypothetical protein